MSVVSATRNLVFFFVLLSGLNSFAQRGAIVMPQNLAQVAAQAAQIVHGRITAVRVEPHPQYKHLQSVVVTLSVTEALKGIATGAITFRQFLWDPRDVREMNGYHTGQEVVLFLNPVSDVGFTSPVGLDQGRFRVETDASGAKMASSAHSNLTLMSGVSQMNSTTRLSARTRQSLVSTESSGGPIPLDSLKETVRALIAGGRNQ